MKKKVSIILVLLLVLAMTVSGCGKEKTPSTEPPQKEEGTTESGTNKATESTESELIEETQSNTETTMNTENSDTSEQTEKQEQEQESEATQKPEQNKKPESTQKPEQNKKPESSQNPSDNTTSSTISDAEQKIVKEVIKKIIKDGMSELEKAKAIHDYIIMNVDYDVVNYDKNTIPMTSRTVEGTLTTKYAVCQGYAETFKALCQAAGLQCECVYGTATNSAGKTESHGWNQVKIDGKWYNVDVTWDDPSKRNGEAFNDHTYARYEYFLISDVKLEQNHKPENAKHKCYSSLTKQALALHCPWRDYDYITSKDMLKKAVEKYIATNAAVMKLSIDPKYVFGVKVKPALIEVISECGIADDYEIGQITYTTDEWGVHHYTCPFKLNNGVYTKYTLASTEDTLKSEILKLKVGSNATQYLYVTQELIDQTNWFASIGKWLYFDAGLVMECYTTSPFCGNVRKAHITMLRKVTPEDVFIENAYDYAQVESIIKDRLARGITSFTIRYYFDTSMSYNDAFGQVANEMLPQWSETYNLKGCVSAQSNTTCFIIFESK